MKQLIRIAAIAVLVLGTGLACGNPVTMQAQSPLLGGCPIFPANNVWNTPIDTLPVDARSAAYVSSIGANVGMHPDFGAGIYEGGPIGIPYDIVTAAQAGVNVGFDYADESDAGPYPIRLNPPIEYGGDHHILIVQQDTCKLYELFDTSKPTNGGWRAGSGAIFDLRSNALRPDGWTSADAAGLPILPGLARHEEVAAGAILHALRFTADVTRDAYIWPARHQAGSTNSPLVPPIGQRFRLKAGFNIAGFSHDTQVILTALKKYGMFLADNGSNWYLSGVPNAGWDNDTLADELRQLRGSNFEAVDESSLQISLDSGQAKQLVEDTKRVTPSSARQGQSATYTIQIVGDGAAASLSDPLPADITLASGPTTTPAGVSAATYDSAMHTIAWSGSPADALIVQITYTVTVNRATTGVIANTAGVTHGGVSKNLTAMLLANPLRNYLPTLRR